MGKIKDCGKKICARCGAPIEILENGSEWCDNCHSFGTATCPDDCIYKYGDECMYPWGDEDE